MEKNMHHKGGRREGRIQERMDKMVSKIAKLEEENKQLQAKANSIHEMYEPIIGKLHRMYCVPSQADELMAEVLNALSIIEIDRN
jgi:predicted RNase H-like nuclease (RuvC/YqgF family)